MGRLPDCKWDHTDNYPDGKAFGEILEWHLLYWGTGFRDNTPGKKGKPWILTHFCREIHQDNSASKESDENYSKKLRTWRDGEHLPGNMEMLDQIIHVLFHHQECPGKWKSDLKKAWEDEWEQKGRKSGGASKPGVDHSSLADNNHIGADARAGIAVIAHGPTKHFMGRDDDVRELAARLTSAGDHAILIQGGPGIGKTELTKVVADHPDIVTRFGERRWFVPLETAATASRMQQAIVRTLGYEPSVSFQAALHGMQGKQTLLILDNLETPWESPEGCNEVETNLAQLRNVQGLSLLGSFRGRGSVGDIWTRKPLRGLSDEAASALFASIAGEWVLDDPLLAGFIRKLGGIPLAIDLVARRADTRDNLAPLWREWREIGTDFVKLHGREEGRLTSLSRSIQLSLQSPQIVAQSSPSALRLFDLLGILPAGLCPEDRDAVMGCRAYDAEDCLLRTGLAVPDNGRTSLLPPIAHDLSDVDAAINAYEQASMHYRHTGHAHNESTCRLKIESLRLSD